VLELGLAREQAFEFFGKSEADDGHDRVYDET
jgi:hypothetical protein